MYINPTTESTLLDLREKLDRYSITEEDVPKRLRKEKIRLQAEYAEVKAKKSQGKTFKYPVHFKCFDKYYRLEDNGDITEKLTR